MDNVGHTSKTRQSVFSNKWRENTSNTKFINRRFGNVHSDIQSINSQYSSRDTHPGTHLKTRHGVDATKHPGIQLINRNHVDSTTEPEIQLINTIPPNRPGIKPDFWNLWSLSKTTENIKTHDMPTTPPPNHQVKGEGINHIKELDLRSKLQVFNSMDYTLKQQTM